METIKINSKYFGAFLKGNSSYDFDGKEYHIKLTNSEQIGKSSNGNKYFYVYGYDMIDGRKYITDWTTNKNNKLLDEYLNFYEINDKNEYDVIVNSYKKLNSDQVIYTSFLPKQIEKLPKKEAKKEPKKEEVKKESNPIRTFERFGIDVDKLAKIYYNIKGEIRRSSNPGFYNLDYEYLSSESKEILKEFIQASYCWGVTEYHNKYIEILTKHGWRYGKIYDLYGKIDPEMNPEGPSYLQSCEYFVLSNLIKGFKLNG